MKGGDGQKGKVAVHLGQIRQSKGISQADVAFRLQVSKSKIDSIEQGRQHLPLTDFMAYCQALDVCPVQVLQQLAQAELAAAPLPRPPQNTRRGLCERYGLRKRTKKYSWHWMNSAADGSGLCKVSLWRVPMKPKRAVHEEEE